MLWLVLLGTALMGAGILLIVLQRDRAGSVAQLPPSSWSVDDHVRTTSFAHVEPPTVTVRVNAAPANRRALGATPAGWCPPSM